MFAKLLKHEWRSTAGILGILSAAALAAGVAGTVIIRIKANDLSYHLSSTVGMTGVMFCIIMALIAYAFAVPVILLVRFYKHKFTDEGYLTFTLPVNSHQVFLSSLLNMVIWSLISALVISVCVFMMVYIGPATEGFSTMTWIDDLSGMLDFSDYTDYWYIYVLQAVISPLYSMIAALTCLTVGATAAKKHKVLTAFGAYYALSFVVGILEGLMTSGITEAYANSWFTADGPFMAQMTALSLALQLAVAVGCYFLSTWLMKRKLNLN